MSDRGRRKFLLLAYYFPPLGMGGVQRTAKFVKYLPLFGWEPVVVTVKDTAYFAKDHSLAEEVAQARVERTESLDPQRLLFLARRGLHRHPTKGEGVAGTAWKRYEALLRWLFVPDAKILWVPFGLVRAWRLHRRERIRVVMTTSPPPSAHLAGLLLRQFAGCRWVADFRDQWTGGHLDLSPTPLHRAVNKWLERIVLHHADAVVCVSHALAASLKSKSRRRDFASVVIPNGYDEEDFGPSPPRAKRGKLLVYCGSVGRLAHPGNYLKACAALIQKRRLNTSALRVVFVGTAIGVDLQGLVSQLGLERYVEVTGYLEHRAAVRWLQAADVLVLLLTGTTSQDVVPGKVFEYLRARKPILAVASPGETVDLLEESAPQVVICQDTPEAIEQGLDELLYGASKVTEGSRAGLERFERRHLAARLAEVLNSV